MNGITTYFASQPNASQPFFKNFLYFFFVYALLALGVVFAITDTVYTLLHPSFREVIDPENFIPVYGFIIALCAQAATCALFFRKMYKYSFFMFLFSFLNLALILFLSLSSYSNGGGYEVLFATYLLVGYILFTLLTLLATYIIQRSVFARAAVVPYFSVLIPVLGFIGASSKLVFIGLLFIILPFTAVYFLRSFQKIHHG